VSSVAQKAEVGNANIQQMAHISIGLPVFNGERYIAQAIESILAQTVEDLELVISDNASTDGTQRICEGLAARDNRIRYFRNPVNHGAAWNFREVFRLSTAPYFKWAACDDWIAPQHLERCAAALERDPEVVLSYSRTRVVDAAGGFVEDHDDRFELCRSARPHERLLGSLSGSRCCFPLYGVIRASALRQTPLLGGFPAGDYVMLAQLALLGKFHEEPDRLYHNRRHAESGSRTYGEVGAQAVFMDPKNRGKAPVRWFRLLAEFDRSIRHSPISAAERVRCHLVVLKWLVWNFGQMALELAHLARWWLFRPGDSARSNS
jgi:glycosyltransferase involved in cell wall biosynthesis